MNQTDFEKINRDRGRKSVLEDWITTSAELVAENQGDVNVVPDGGEWLDANGQGVGIIQTNVVTREAYRNYCVWRELTLPNGQRGIYVEAHGPNADRFR